MEQELVNFLNKYSLNEHSDLLNKMGITDMNDMEVVTQEDLIKAGASNFISKTIVKYVQAYFHGTDEMEEVSPLENNTSSKEVYLPLVEYTKQTMISKLEDEKLRQEREIERSLRKMKKMTENELELEEIEDKKNEITIKREIGKKQQLLKEKENEILLKEIKFKHQQEINLELEKVEQSKKERMFDPMPHGLHISMISWLDTSDNFGGLRTSTYNSNVVFAVSKSDYWDKTRQYEIPIGYRWMSTSEALSIFVGSNAGTYTYFNQGGWSGYVWNGITRHYFRFCDSVQTNAYKHAGCYDPYTVQYKGTTTHFAGLVFIRV